MIQQTKRYLLRDLLRDVSRTFYLTLRILPGKIRSQIGLAYLLARASDTIADTEILPAEQRLAALRAFRERILGRGEAAFSIKAFEQAQHNTSEAQLLARVDDVFECFVEFSPSDQALIRAVIETIIGGQELDLQRFNQAKTEGSIASLQSGGELDDYTYRVAGCVGEFWTKTCQAHLFQNIQAGTDFNVETGIRFGKGLQLINILRDAPRDLRQGRCYFPSDELRQAGLQPKDLLSPANEARFRPIYNRWLERAEEDLRAGWAYTNAIPQGMFRLRLACAWPILIGWQTLQRLRGGVVLDADRRIKISRQDVKGIIVRTIVYYPFRKTWQSLLSGH